MIQLNFPTYKFKLKNRENKPLVWDPVRKKWVVLQPEEWDRQHCIAFLLEDKKYPLELINVEKKIQLNGRSKRYDIIVFRPTGKPHILIECKAPTVSITQKSFDQIAQYNMALNSTYLMVTNGMDHYFCQIDAAQTKYQFLKSLPVFKPSE